MTTKKNETTKEEIEVYKARLTAMFEKCPRVYTALQHVSASGMQRSISLYVPTIDSNGQIQITDITGYAAAIMNDRRDHKRGGIIVKGCGMDMGFSLVYNLSCSLYCPGTYDHEAAYKLKQEWL